MYKTKNNIDGKLNAALLIFMTLFDFVRKYKKSYPD